MFDQKKVISQLMLERGMTINDMAEKLEINPQSFRNKLNRGTYGLNDFIKILDILDGDLKVIARDSGKVFD